MPYRAAVIGCGLIGSAFADDPRAPGIYSHAAAYVTCPETDLVAVCDIDQARAEQCATRWGVPAAYADVDDLLASEHPALVSVCTPDASHFDVVRSVLSAPSTRGVLAEKPIATTLEHADHLVALARVRGISLAVNYVRRYAPTHVKLREWIRDGGIGAVQTVGGLYTKGTLHNGTHWFDLARFFVGDVVEVWGFDARREGGVDPTLDAFLRFGSGASAHLHGCDATAFSVFELDVIGTTGRVRLTESGHHAEVQHVIDSPYYSGYRTLGASSERSSDMDDLLLRAVEDLVRSVGSGAAPRCAGEDGLEALRIALAVQASAASGNPVQLGGPDRNH